MSGITKLKIGNVELNNNLILAPMAGFGDIAFRRICKDYGAGLTVTEMISAKGLLYKNTKTEQMLRLGENESPSCAQLFGSEPKVFEEVIKNSPLLKKFDIIDINMGCPVSKVTKAGEGSALLLDIKTACDIVSACKKATDKPITVKFRIGWDLDNIVAVPFAKEITACGASMLAVHGRTTKQLYGGKADWDIIEQVANAVNVPVIGNGDIDGATVCMHRLKSSCMGVMIGRGALGRPDIFADILSEASRFGNTESGMEYKQNGSALLEIILKHIQYMTEYFPERYTVTNMRKHLAYYLRGVPSSKEFKNKINWIEDLDELKNELSTHMLKYSEI